MDWYIFFGWSSTCAPDSFELVVQGTWRRLGFDYCLLHSKNFRGHRWDSNPGTCICLVVITITILLAIWRSALAVYLRRWISYSSSLRKIEVKPSTVFLDTVSPKWRSALPPPPIQSLWQDWEKQTAGDSNYLGGCPRRASLNIDQEKCLPHKFPATNYTWDARKKREL